MQKFKVYFWYRLPSSMFKELKKKYSKRLKDYMNVYICDGCNEMYDLCDKLEKEKLERDYAGRTFTYTKNYYEIDTGEYIKTSPCCGYIALDKNQMYMDAIAHESTHAVIGYFSRKLKDEKNIFTNTNDIGVIIEGEYEELSEELFCYMVGNISEQIAEKYDK